MPVVSSEVYNGVAAAGATGKDLNAADIKPKMKMMAHSMRCSCPLAVLGIISR
jgi:hypothetical protein